MCDRDLICNYSNIFSRKLIQISKYIHSHIRDWVFLIPLNENIIKRERCCVTRNVCFDEIFGFLVLNKHPEYTVIYFSNVVQKMLKVNFVSSLTLFIIKKYYTGMNARHFVKMFCIFIIFSQQDHRTHGQTV